MYDIIVIGGGPAGLTAAVYAGRADKKVLILEKSTFGGQITSSPKVENIPGFLSVSGNEFAEKLIEQAMSLDAEIECSAALKLIPGKPHTVVTDDGEYKAKSVIIATGTTHRLLGLEREEEFIGNGISFCAVCDGAFYSGKTVAVIGGGNSALQEAILLSELCKKVYLIQNLSFLTGEKKLQNAVYQKDNIEVILNTVVTKLSGEGDLTRITVSDGEKEYDIDIDGMFTAIGLVPQNEIFNGTLSLDRNGYIPSGEDCLTSVEGVFVAGDCRAKRIRQVATAVSDGAVAALAACNYLMEY
ncbi:MAG: FAD-dependent oxidoreductase [Clostridia bacterium]|nr:FAD-dependent oxidoreductase [Clostridia bacterium]